MKVGLIGRVAVGEGGGEGGVGEAGKKERGEVEGRRRRGRGTEKKRG